MLLLLIVAVVGGAASVLTPCVLPLLPSLVALSGRGGRRRALGIVVGIEVSFVGIVLVLGAALGAAGLPARTLELVAATMLATFGLVLLVPRLERAFATASSRLVARAPARVTAGGPPGDTDARDGFGGGLAAGLALGLVWTPCAGPILAGITASSNIAGPGGRTAAVALAYGLGMLVPLLALAFGGQRVGLALRRRLRGGTVVAPVMGVLLLATATLVATGELARVNRALAEGVNVTSTPTAPLERAALELDDAPATDARAGRPSRERLERAGYPESRPGELVDLGPAPEFAGISRWYNTPSGQPLTQRSLRGKVVLIDFWTYSCINCLRTLPHLRDLHRRYADDGLVIVGVHTPEFEFEKDPGNVRRAIADLNVRWPVALDPDYATWQRYYNHYWPAHYLIDREGTIRNIHYGEGAYRETELLVRELLDGQGRDGRVGSPGASGDDDELHPPRFPTPESYLGYSRASAAQFASRGPGGLDTIARDAPARYVAPATLQQDEWALDGRWRVEAERSVALSGGARLRLHYQARDVHLVLGPPPGTRRARVIVRDGDAPPRTITVDGHRLYTLRRGGGFRSSTIQLTLDPGVSAYAFTFRA